MDFGCGHGDFLRALHSKALRCVGIEIQQDLLENLDEMDFIVSEIYKRPQIYGMIVHSYFTHLSIWRFQSLLLKRSEKSLS